jgi:hypothetical protein
MSLSGLTMLLHLKLTDPVVLMQEHLSSVSLIELLVVIEELVVLVCLLFCTPVQACTPMQACTSMVLGCLRLELTRILEVLAHSEIWLLIKALLVLRTLIYCVYILREVLAGHGWILINMRCIKGT